MAHVRKGYLTGAGQWWKHLRWTKRSFWKRHRKAEVEKASKLEKWPEVMRKDD